MPTKKAIKVVAKRTVASVRKPSGSSQKRRWNKGDVAWGALASWLRANGGFLDDKSAVLVVQDAFDACSDPLFGMRSGAAKQTPLDFIRIVVANARKQGLQVRVGHDPKRKGFYLDEVQTLESKEAETLIRTMPLRISRRKAVKR
jgi:hypothetical protein